MVDRDILIGRGAICTALGIGKNTFYRLVAEGLPVKKRGGSWSGLRSEIRDFFSTPPTHGPGSGGIV